VRVELLFPVFDDHALAPAGDLVQLLAHRLVFDDVHEAHQARHVRHDRVGVRVPREQHRVLRHLLASSTINVAPSGTWKREWTASLEAAVWPCPWAAALRTTSPS